MEWKILPGFNNRYSVSEYGDVYDNETKLLRNKRDRKDLYYDVNLFNNGKWIQILCHRAVLIAFNGHPTKEHPLTRHLDGNRKNNHISNLCWGTYEENRADRLLHGTSGTGIHEGEKSASAVLKNGDVLNIKRLLQEGKLYHRQIADMYGVKREAISKINSGKRWKHISLC